MIGQILVSGGTGTLGRVLVRRLVDEGTPVRVLSRRPPPAGRPPVGWSTGDLKTGRGIDAAVAGVGGIVHCATGLGDVGAARHLIESARRAGSPQVVYISIVGVDRIPFGYYKSKLEAERLVESSGLPWTVLRATQFHQLILRGCEALARLPVMLAPGRVEAQGVDDRGQAPAHPGRHDLVEQCEGVGGRLQVVLAAAHHGAQLVRGDHLLRAVPGGGPSRLARPGGPDEHHERGIGDGRARPGQRGFVHGHQRDRRSFMPAYPPRAATATLR